MNSKTLLAGVVASAALLSTQALADETNPDEPRTISGISILGNQEAPKSLVIVPWKGSEIGADRGLSPDLLDNGAVPVDRDVFLRQLDYYRIRSGHQTEL